jgi:hypothetical protein
MAAARGTFSQLLSPPLRYPLRSLLPDYAGSAFGLACSVGPLAFAAPAAAVAWVLAAIAALFLVYFGRTVCRHLTHIERDETGIRACGPLGAAIRWENLRSLRVDYYSTRRDNEGGWMQLRIRDARRTIRVDSGLDGFVDLVRVALAEARRRGIDLDAATRANLAALGLAE